MHIKGKNNWIKHLDFTVLNMLALVGSFVVAYYIRFGDFGFISITTWKTVLAMIFLVDLVVLFFVDPFSGIFRREYYADAIQQFSVSFYSFVIVSILFYVLKIGINYSRITIVVTFGLYLISSTIIIMIRKKLILSGKVMPVNVRILSLLVIADPDRISKISNQLSSADVTEYEIAACAFPLSVKGGSVPEGIKRIDIKDVVEFVVTNDIDDVFIACDPSILDSASYRDLIANGVTIHLDIESLIGIEPDDQFVSRVGTSKSLSIGPYSFDARRMVYLAVKRVLDVIIGIAGCLILLPLYVIIKVSYALTGDKAPIVYSQDRVGQYGKPFKLYKFRSMKPDADEILKEMLKEEKYRKEWEEKQKFDDDPRVTKVGKFLRKTSLDEFPQFLNILKGDMSLVGPRPLVEGELEDHGGLTLYNKVRPGITGWWGCNGRSNIDYKERLELEYYYVQNCSLYLDIVCIIKTAKAVLKREGAK